MHTQHDTPSVAALILAGGSGQRIASARPKQFVEVDGVSIIHRTLQAFSNRVDRIVVACQDEWRDYVVSGLSSALGDFSNGNVVCCTAGATGYESLCSGIAALSDCPDETLVMIHDAVRPLVTPEVIADNLSVARTYGNAIASVEVYETLLCAPECEGTVRTLTRREGMFRAQTPQTFRLGALRKMISDARRLCIVDAQSACVLAQQLGYELHLSQGDLQNFKITKPSDLELYRTIIKGTSDTPNR